MNHTVTTKWLDKMAFETDFDGHKIVVDADEKFGGENRGPLPKPLLLNALSGCTAMDVVSILNKMKVEFETFDIEVDAHMTEEHPKYYDKIHLIYTFKGQDLPLNKLEKAVNLSQERYCGVSAMLMKSSEITYEIKTL